MASHFGVEHRRDPETLPIAAAEAHSSSATQRAPVISQEAAVDRTPSTGRHNNMYGPPRHTPIQSEAELQRERAELKAWRKRKVETLAARRRAVRVLRGDLTSPPNARIGRKRRKALGGRAPPQTPSQPTDATVETPARALTSPLTTATAAALRRRPSEGQPLATEDSQEARIFDHFLVVGLPSRLVEHPDVAVGARYSPKVLHHLSPTGAPTQAEAIADFCLPAGAKVSAAQAGEGRRPGALNAVRGVKEVIFVLSGGGRDGSRVQYGVCAHASRFYESVSDDADRPPLVEVDVCYCIVTQFPFLPLHFSVLRSAIRAEIEAFETRKHPRSRRYAAAHAALKTYSRVPPPGPGLKVEVNIGEVIEWTRPRRRRPKLSRAPRDEATRLAREWSLPVVLGRLSLENVLRVLACALLELRVVFVSRDLQTLSACALGAVSLLRPLRWAGPLISALPADLRDYLDSPVPLILGVTGLPLHFEQGADMVLAFADEDRVRLPPNSVMLPRYDALVEKLRPLVEVLRHDLKGHLPAAQTPNTRTSADAASAFGDDVVQGADDDDRLQSPGWRRPPSAEALKALDSVVDGVHAHLRLLLAGARSIREARMSSKKKSLKQSVGNDVWEGLGGDEGEAFISRVEQTQMYSNYHHSQPQVGPDAEELLRRLDDGFDDGAEYSSSSDESLEEDLTVSPDDAFWCRGRCNGALDTPFCTQQCIREWERRTRLEKAQELSRYVAPEPRAREPLKHRNETRSQWAHRASLHSSPRSPSKKLKERPPFGFHCSVDPRGRFCCDRRRGGTAAPVQTKEKRRSKPPAERPMRRGGYAGRGPSNLALVRGSEDRKDERRHDAALVLQRKSRRDRLCRALEAAAVAARSRMDVDVSSEEESVESAKLGSTSGDFEAFLVDDSGVTEQKESVIRVWQSTKARILYEALAAWRDRVDSDDEYPLSDESDVAPRAPSPVASRVTSPVKPSPITLNAAASLIELAADEPPTPSVPVSADRRASASSAESPAELNRRQTLQLRDSFGVEELEDFDDDHSGDARSRSDSGADLSSRGSGGDLAGMLAPPESSPVLGSPAGSSPSSPPSSIFERQAKPPSPLPPPPPPSPPPQLMSPSSKHPVRSLSCSSDDAALSLRKAISPIARPLAAEDYSSYDDVEFRAALRQGFVAVKHGRRGRAHRRRFRASEDLSELTWTAEDEPASVVHAGLRRLKRVSKSRRVVRMADVQRVCGRGSSRVLQRAHSAGRVFRPFTVSLVLHDGSSVDLEFQDAAKHRAMLRGFTRLAAAARKLYDDDGERDPWEEAVAALAVKAGPE